MVAESTWIETRGDAPPRFHKHLDPAASRSLGTRANRRARFSPSPQQHAVTMPRHVNFSTLPTHLHFRTQALSRYLGLSARSQSMLTTIPGKLFHHADICGECPRRPDCCGYGRQPHHSCTAHGGTKRTSMLPPLHISKSTGQNIVQLL